MRQGFRVVFLVVTAVRWGARPFVLWCLGRPEPVERLAKRLRAFMQDMGLTFVKFGQYLSIRLDLLPAVICDELAELYHRVPPMPFKDAVRQIEGDLGAPWSRHFQMLDPEPVAGASIAQVHRAIALDGQVLALKVQRHGIEEILEADLRLLRKLAWALDLLGLLNTISARQIVDEIGDFTRGELDFAAEGHNADRLRGQVPLGVTVPAIRWDLSGPRVLAMTFVEGLTLLEISRLLERGDRATCDRMIGDLDLDRIVDRLGQACFHQIFVTGLFHGDPHPANIIVEPDGGLAFVDFGIFAELDREMRTRFASYVERVAFGRLDEAFGHLTGLIKPSEGTDLRGFRHAAVAIMRDWYAASRDPQAVIESRLAAHYQGRLLDAMRRHHVRMPPNQLLFWRALAEVDATAHRLPGTFDLLSAMRAFFVRKTAPAARIAALLTPLLEAPSAPDIRLSLERATRDLSDVAQGNRRLAVDSRPAYGQPVAHDRGVVLIAVALASVAVAAGLLGAALLAAPDAGASFLTVAAPAIEDAR